jgi:hypothetical protein
MTPGMALTTGIAWAVLLAVRSLPYLAALACSQAGSPVGPQVAEVEAGG